MRKITLVRLTLALTLAAATAGGLLLPKPAYALICTQRPNCAFLGVEPVGNAICCVYDCPLGTVYGPCQPI